MRALLRQLLGVVNLRMLFALAMTLPQAAFRAAPNRVSALRSYRVMAPVYELLTLGGDQWRRVLVERLAPRPGETILDVGCGTGRNFEQLVERIGATGCLIGIEPSPEMLARARTLVERRGWTNVQLIHAGAEEAAIRVTADAALLCAVHDVMRSPSALANVLAHLRDGGRLAAGGAKWAPGWQVRLNFETWLLNHGCVSTLEGFAEPWSRLAELVPALEVEELRFGGGYIASGTVSASRSPAEAGW